MHPRPRHIRLGPLVAGADLDDVPDGAAGERGVDDGLLLRELLWPGRCDEEEGAAAGDSGGEDRGRVVEVAEDGGHAWLLRVVVEGVDLGAAAAEGAGGRVCGLEEGEGLRAYVAGGAGEEDGGGLGGHCRCVLDLDFLDLHVVGLG